MKELIRPAGEVLLKFLESEQGRKALGKGAEVGMAAARKGGQALGALGKGARDVASEAVYSGVPKFAEAFAQNKGPIGNLAYKAGNLTDAQIEGAASLAGQIAKPVAQGVALLGTGALVGGALTKPETAYSAAMDTIAAREASAYGIIDAKLQADAERQLGNERLAARKFEQSLYLQEQRQQHEMMMAQARAEARTPMNQPMSGSKLFDPMAMAQGMLGGIPQY
jgi:hypothetical protein